VSLRRAPHPFWRFSLGFYGRSGVEQACLGLQNACGADVNLLLFCCWAGNRGRALDKRSLHRAVSAVRPWQEEIVQPLRRARRSLKRSGAGAYRSVLGLELDAEYVEQLLLAGLAARLPPPGRRHDPQAACAANLERYLELLGAAVGSTTRRRMMILCEQTQKPMRTPTRPTG
jgi:uncharacterized protein (TIGR02444 family)